MIRISRTLWRFRFSSADSPPINSYIWDSPGGLLVIDPVSQLSKAALHEALGRNRVDEIWITHVQEEHAAGAFNFPEATVRVPAGDEYLCEGSNAYRKLISSWPSPWDWTTRGNYRGHLAGAANERPLTEPLRLGAPLTPGSQINGCSVIATPGHGKHAITLLANIDGAAAAFCGDLILGNGRLLNWFDCDWDYGPQTGQRALLSSIRRLKKRDPTILLPSHGEPIVDPHASMDLLVNRLSNILDAPCSPEIDLASFEVSSRPSAPGFRELLPGLHQYVETPGNCAVLVSDSGYALMIDDGLCYGSAEAMFGLEERARHHQRVMSGLKQTLGVQQVELLIPTHYHGDHLENIPEIVEMDGTRVVCLDLIADPILHPDRYNLACPLPWYGTRYDTIPIHETVPDGTRMTWREFELEIFHLAGQTYFHSGIAVTVNDRRVVFAGDSFNPSTECEPILTYNDNEPLERGWVYALDRLLERQPDLLVLGHAAAVQNPVHLIQLKRTLWKNRIKAFDAINGQKSLRSFFDPFHAKTADEQA